MRAEFLQGKHSRGPGHVLAGPWCKAEQGPCSSLGQMENAWEMENWGGETGGCELLVENFGNFEIYISVQSKTRFSVLGQSPLSV